MALFSKKEYEWLADFMRDQAIFLVKTKQEEVLPYFTVMMKKMAHDLAEDNSKFSYERFMHAVGLEY